MGRRESESPNQLTPVPSGRSSASPAIRGSSRLSTTVSVVARATCRSMRRVVSISPKRSSWSRITLSSRQIRGRTCFTK